MDIRKIVSAEELLGIVFAKLVVYFKAKKIVFKYTPRAEIVSDWDQGSNRYGYMCYTKIALADINNLKCIIAFGQRDQGYLTERFGNDLLMKTVEDKKFKNSNVQEIIEKEIEYSAYFRNSVLSTTEDGIVFVSKKSYFFNKLNIIDLKRYIAQEIEYQKGIINFDGTSIASQQMLYHNDLVEELFKRLRNIMEELILVS